MNHYLLTSFRKRHFKSPRPLSVCLSRFVCPTHYICLSHFVCLTLSVFLYLSLRLSICLTLSVWLSMHLSLSVSFYLLLFVFLSLFCLSLSLSPSVLYCLNVSFGLYGLVHHNTFKQGRSCICGAFCLSLPN